MSTLTQYPVLGFAGTDTGTGTALTSQSGVAATYGIQVEFDTDGTVGIEGTIDGTTYRPILVVNLADGSQVAAITASGLYRVDATCLTGVQPVVHENTSGVTAVASLVEG